MADKPIIFSAPMIRALLDGRKTMTRRVIKKRSAIDALTIFGPTFLTLRGNVDLVGYAAGDRLWVREILAADSNDQGARWITYAADRSLPSIGLVRWDWKRNGLPSIHMPRWASRLTLIVTDVRVERLQDISEADARSEGATMRPECEGEALDMPGWSMDWGRVRPDGPWENDIALPTPKGAFLNYFHMINDYPAKFGDDPSIWPNPWVAAYTFRVIKRNIDQIGGEA